MLHRWSTTALKRMFQSMLIILFSAIIPSYWLDISRLISAEIVSVMTRWCMKVAELPSLSLPPASSIIIVIS